MLRVSRIATVDGELRPPSDKSLTHRALMLGAIAEGRSTIRQPLQGDDCRATASCLEALGSRFERMNDGSLSVEGGTCWKTPGQNLECGNSGTTMRLLSGLVASRPVRATLSGDPSLSKRPMRRIVEPLRLMGAKVEGEYPPLTIDGGELRGIEYASPIASAQVKSCILFAGLRAEGRTQVTEPSLSRDHTERMLQACGVQLTREGLTVTMDGGQSLHPFDFEVPADISSAAFWMVAAALSGNGRVLLRDVGVNPTRTGVLDVLAQVGARFIVHDAREVLGEPVASIEVFGDGAMMPFEIGNEMVPRLIDEIPILAVLATQLDGISTIRGASELRVKESDRIEAVAAGLRSMGADVVTHPDGLDVHGPTKLKGTAIDANHDHRIAMSFAIAGLFAEGETTITGSETIASSYPEFEKHLWSICVV